MAPLTPISPISSRILSPVVSPNSAFDGHVMDNRNSFVEPNDKFDERDKISVVEEVSSI